MSKKRIGCGCDYCEGNGIRKDFRRDHGGGPEEIPYRKKGKGGKFCKRAKGKTPHDWTGRLTIMVMGRSYNYETSEWERTQVPKTYIVCARCGKGKTYISRWA